MYAPEFLDPDRYNWEKHSWTVAKYTPELFDPDRYNWEENSVHIEQ